MPAKRERLLRTLQFEYTGRVLLLGGWILGDHQQQAIAGVSEKAYWQDPERWVIEAHRALDIDGRIMVVVPTGPGEYRYGEFFNQANLEGLKERYKDPEDVFAFAQSLPSPKEALKQFDADAWREEFKAKILTM